MNSRSRRKRYVGRWVVGKRGRRYYIATSDYFDLADENAVLGDCQIGSGSNTLFEIRIWADISLEVQNPWRPLYLVPVDIKPCRTGIANLPSGVITTSVDHVCRLSVL